MHMTSSFQQVQNAVTAQGHPPLVIRHDAADPIPVLLPYVAEQHQIRYVNL